ALEDDRKTAATHSESPSGRERLAEARRAVDAATRPALDARRCARVAGADAYYCTGNACIVRKSAAARGRGATTLARWSRTRPTRCCGTERRPDAATDRASEPDSGADADTAAGVRYGGSARLSDRRVA